MPQTLTRYERETHFNYNEESSFADIDTRNPSLMRQLRQLAIERPNEVRLKINDSDHICAVVPKKWVKLRPSRLLTDEQRQRLSERGKNLAFCRQNSLSNQ